MPKADVVMQEDKTLREVPKKNQKKLKILKQNLHSLNKKKAIAL